MKICATCGEVYGDDAQVCGLDGTTLAAWDQANQGRAPASSDTHPTQLLSGGGPKTDSSSEGVTNPIAVPPVGNEPTRGRLLAERYLLEGQIGTGGFGAVFAAVDTRLQKQVAVKILSPQVARDPEALARFQQEAVAASQIGHEGIVDVTDFDTDTDGTQFIVMEYLDGTDLANVIEDEERLEPVRALSIAIQTSHALAVAHHKGILHRDLKPANIFLLNRELRDDFAKVIDFGISKVLHGQLGADKLTSTGQIIGTPYYMAPEQAAGGDIDGRADIYSLAIILYEMLTGEPPFSGRTYLEVITKHLAEPPERPTNMVPDLPEGAILDRLLLTALAKEPDERQPSMAAFGDAMLTVLARLDPVMAASLRPKRLRSSPGLSQTWPATDDSAGHARITSAKKSGLLSTLGASAGELNTRDIEEYTAGKHGSSRRLLAIASGATAIVAVAAFALLRGGSSDNASPTASAPKRPQAELVTTAPDAGRASTPEAPRTFARRVTIVAQIAGAEVFGPDDEKLGPLPYTVDAPAGLASINLTIRAKGYKNTPVRVTEDSPDEIRVDLKRRRKGTKKPDPAADDSDDDIAKDW